jgi:hypothetical protein
MKEETKKYIENKQYENIQEQIFLNDIINGTPLFDYLLKNQELQFLKKLLKENREFINYKEEIFFIESCLKYQQAEIIKDFFEDIKTNLKWKNNTLLYYFSLYKEKELIDLFLKKNPKLINEIWEKESSFRSFIIEAINNDWFDILNKYDKWIHLNNQATKELNVGTLLWIKKSNIFLNCLKNFPEFINEINPNKKHFIEYAINNTSEFKKYAEFLNLEKETSEKVKVGSLLALKGKTELLTKVFENNTGSMNQKNPTGKHFIEYCLMKNETNFLIPFAKDLNLEEETSEKIKVGSLLALKGKIELLAKSFKNNPETMNQKNQTGKHFIEYCLMKNETNFLIPFAKDLNLEEETSEKIRVGSLLALKGKTELLAKSFKNNPETMNQKNQTGKLFIEYCLMKNETNFLIPFAKDLNLEKETSEKIRVGSLLALKGKTELLIKAFESNTKSINQVNPTGKHFIEYCLMKNETNFLIPFAKDLNLEKETSEKIKVGSLLVLKGKIELLTKAFKSNPKIINQVNPTGKHFIEYCLMKNEINFILTYVEYINPNLKINDQNIQDYLENMIHKKINHLGIKYSTIEKEDNDNIISKGKEKKNKMIVDIIFKQQEELKMLTKIQNEELLNLKQKNLEKNHKDNLFLKKIKNKL